MIKLLEEKTRRENYLKIEIKNLKNLNRVLGKTVLECQKTESHSQEV